MTEPMLILVLVIGAIGLWATVLLFAVCLFTLAKRNGEHLDEYGARRAIAPVAPNVRKLSAGVAGPGAPHPGREIPR